MEEADCAGAELGSLHLPRITNVSMPLKRLCC
jgi:hypothetical protein